MKLKSYQVILGNLSYLICLICTGCNNFNIYDNYYFKQNFKQNIPQVLIYSGSLINRFNCEVRYIHYHSLGVNNDNLVVLAPGFLRSQQHLHDLGWMLARSGINAATLDFCPQRFWISSHFRNGFTMIGVAKVLHAKRIVYLGFSAGALAALIAGRNDPRAIGVITLDLVDAHGLGALLALGFSKPLIGFAAPKSICNANGNGLLIYKNNFYKNFEQIAEASHCDFEAPTDWLCKLFCESGHQSDSIINQKIMQKVIIKTQQLFKNKLN